MNRIRLLPFDALPVMYLLFPLSELSISPLLLPINAPPLSHLLLPLNVLPINLVLVPLNELLISHLTLLLLDLLPICHPNLLLILQLLYPKTPGDRSKAQWSKTSKKRERSVLHPTKVTQTWKKGSVPIRPSNGNWRMKKSLWWKRNVI